jgi:hypothetical protein
VLGWFVIGYLWVLVGVIKVTEMFTNSEQEEQDMAGYGVKESRIDTQRRPSTTDFCTQCEDTGFVMTSEGIRLCPLCPVEEEVAVG